MTWAICPEHLSLPIVFMTPERYGQVSRICRAALELEPAERAAYLTEVCGGDETLWQEVESLLGHDGRSEGMIDQGALEVVARAMTMNQDESQAKSPSKFPIGQSMGHYRILSL